MFFLQNASLAYIFDKQLIGMQYMVIEKFMEGKLKDVYQRFAERGRLMPEGLTYVKAG
jgi:hypothetical protein